MSTFSIDGSGKTQAHTPDGSTYNLNPQEIKRRDTANKRYPTGENSHKFKLLTVRKLKDTSKEDIEALAKQSYAQLEIAALRTGRPVPYPLPPIGNDVAVSAYGVYIDEDLYGKTAPVYTFVSTSSKIRCFITTTGTHKDAWSIHLIHQLNYEVNPDNTRTNNWRIVSIESTDTDKSYDVLEDSALPDCFKFNFDIDSVVYLGGGAWSAMAVDRADRLPIYAQAPGNTTRYIKVGTVFRYLGESRVKSIVAFSLTPTYVFTWQKGNLKVNKRNRQASQIVDKGKLTGDGVIAFTRQHTYNLEITYRLANLENNNNIQEYQINEFSNGSASYVGNTNCPGIQSLYQNPDFGTDKARLSINSIEMTTNVIRAKARSVSQNKISKPGNCHIPVVCSSPDMAVFLKYDFGQATGFIDHPYEVKRNAAARGFQYGESYKYWWGYGRVIEVIPFGDTNRYRLLKNPGFDENGNRLKDRVVIGSMFDLGECKIDVVPNRAITTWDSLPNPPTGYFGLEEGKLSFWVVYLNPPIIGHQGVYYYHINPPAVGADSGLYEYVPQSDGLNNLNTIKYIYSQMLGALGGGALESLNIGNVTIAGNDIESIIVREPNPTQKAELLENPHTFPAGYFETDIYEFSIDNENVGVINVLDNTGIITKTYPI
jgi:hypothetical protein